MPFSITLLIKDPMSAISFDKTTLTRFYGDSSVDFVEILCEYLKTQDEIQTSLKSAFSEGLESLQSSIHFHSSIFCYVGFPELTNIFLEFEEMCKSRSDGSVLRTEFDFVLSKITESAGIARQEIEKLEQSIC
jgi:hypothetical protein